MRDIGRVTPFTGMVYLFILMVGGEKENFRMVYLSMEVLLKPMVIIWKELLKMDNQMVKFLK